MRIGATLKSVIFITAVNLVVIIFFTVFFSGYPQEKNLKIPLLKRDRPLTLDPLNIVYLDEYNLIENLYSPLIELDRQGNIVSGLAKRFYWKDDAVFLELRNDVFTTDGHPITVEDAILTLKRALILNKNKHGSLQYFTCSETHLESLDQDCQDISATGNQLKIIIRKNKESFLRTLANHDYAVIPHRSIDKSTLEIIDHRNTSGPYYVHHEDDSKLILKANQFHWHFHSNNVQEAIFKKLSKDQLDHSMDLFESKEIDYLPIFVVSKDHSEILSKCNPAECEVHKTWDIGLRFAYFTPKGRQLESQLRLQIGKKIKAVYNQYIADFQRPADQYFFPLGEGGLSKSDLDQVLLKYANISTPEFINEKLVIGHFGSGEDIKMRLKTYFPQATFVSISNATTNLNQNFTDEIDLIILNNDVSTIVDIADVSYQANMGLFGQTQEEANQWLKTFTETKSSDDRKDLLQKVHLEILINPIIIPLINEPYIAVVRKPWTFKEQIKISPSDALWNIKLN